MVNFLKIDKSFYELHRQRISYLGHLGCHVIAPSILPTVHIDQNIVSGILVE